MYIDGSYDRHSLSGSFSIKTLPDGSIVQKRTSEVKGDICLCLYLSSKNFITSLKVFSYERSVFQHHVYRNFCLLVWLLKSLFYFLQQEIAPPQFAPPMPIPMGVPAPVPPPMPLEPLPPGMEWTRIYEYIAKQNMNFTLTRAVSVECT